MRNRKNIKLKNTSEQRNIKQSEESSPKISVVERKKRKITFNFSFMTSNKNYNLDSENFKEDVGIIFCKRLKKLSDSQFTSLLAMNKKRGLETLKISDLSANDKIKKMEFDSEFKDSRRNELSGNKLWIFRLCPNNNPYPSRLIGCLIDQTFYLMFFDYNHDLYSKRQ